MSATIDYRTDKMYWMGFLNNGLKNTPNADGSYTRSIAEGGRDTGIYEIDTETGSAKLIGKTNFVNIIYEFDEDGQVEGAHSEKYGKMQTTGIYVEGSIIRKAYDLKVTMKQSPMQMAVGQESYGNVIVTVKNRGTQTMPGMEFMQVWMMPIMMVFICNNLSAGLSYYYLLSNLITIVQNWAIRKWFIDEDKLYENLKKKANSKEAPKKSKFQQRLDAAYKAQQEQMRQQNKKK